MINSFEHAMTSFNEALDWAVLASMEDIGERRLRDLREALRNLLQNDMLKFHDLEPELRELVSDDDGGRPAVLYGAPYCEGADRH